MTNRQTVPADAVSKFQIVHVSLHVHGRRKGLSEIAIVLILCTLHERRHKDSSSLVASGLDLEDVLKIINKFNSPLLPVNRYKLLSQV